LSAASSKVLSASGLHPTHHNTSLKRQLTNEVKKKSQKEIEKDREDEH